MTNGHEPEELPDFDSERELVEWFEQADLTQYRLDEALEVAAATRVTLSLDEPWAAEDQSGLTGQTGEIELVKS